MKKLIDYCYYRTANFYEWYRDLGETHLSGSIVVFGFIGANCLSILAVILSLFDKKFSLLLIGGVLGVFIIASFFYDSDKRYKELCERYKNETHKTLKGWLVFGYFVGSIVLYFVSLAVFKV